jgi:UDP:flavonoid glycosyltransferase YjiC (YdhE family)
MKALFFPSYMGGGFGHISRCLALAQALEQRGWQTGFALAGLHLEKVRASDAGRQIYKLHRPFQPRPERGDTPAYTFVSGLSYQLLRDGLVSPAAIRASVAEQLAVVRRFRPQVIIGDTWPLASIVADLAGLPLVQISRAITHPQGPGVIWWQDLPAELAPPDLRPLINPLLAEWGMVPIDRAEDLLRGDLYLVPSLPELDPLPEAENILYSGPFVRPGQEELPDWVHRLEAGPPVVYASTGGGAAGVGGLSFYHLLIDALWGAPLRVVVSTGTRLSPAELPPLPANFTAVRWAPGPAVIARSRLALYAGGFGTTMELARLGTPGLAIPFHSEQESNARRLAAAGAARILLPSRVEPTAIWYTGPGGRFSTLIRSHSDLTAADLRQAVLKAVSDDSLCRGAQGLKVRAAKYGGQTLAADQLEDWLAGKPALAQPGWERLSWRQKWGLRG